MKYGETGSRPGPDSQWRDEIENIDAHASQIRIPQRYLQDIYALKQDDWHLYGTVFSR